MTSKEPPTKPSTSTNTDAITPAFSNVNESLKNSTLGTARQIMINILLLFVWAAVCLYVGIGAFSMEISQQNVNEFAARGTIQSEQSSSVVVDGLSFASIQDYVVWRNLEDARALFPWTRRLPSFVRLAIVLAASASLGAVLECGHRLARGNCHPTMLPAISGPALGLLTGIVVFVVLAASGVLLTGSTKFYFHPLPMLLVGLISGLFAEEVYDATILRLKRVIDIL